MSNPTASSPTADPADSKRNQILVVLISTTLVAVISYLMRMYVRLRVVKSLGWDDLAMTVAMAFAIVTLVFESLAIHHGIGIHKVFLTPESAIEASKWSTLSITPNLLAINIARISLCLLMLRIASNNRAYKVFLYSIIFGTICFSSTSCVSTYITCIPVEKVWNQALPGACDLTRRGNIGLVVSSWTIAADWTVSLFPIVMLRRVQMALKTKIALAIIMGMGFFIGVIVLLKSLKVGALFSRVDPTYDSADLATWAVVEQNVGILLVNVPAIRPLFSRVFAFSRKESSDKKSGPLGQSYNLRDLSRTKGSHLHSNTIMNGRASADDSDSSLVGKDSHTRTGMPRTVDFSQTSYIHLEQQRRGNPSMV